MSCSVCHSKDNYIKCDECSLLYCSTCYIKRHSRGTFRTHCTLSNPNGSACAECEKVLLSDKKPFSTSPVRIKPKDVYCTDCELEYCSSCNASVHRDGALKDHLKPGKNVTIPPDGTDSAAGSSSPPVMHADPVAARPEPSTLTSSTSSESSQSKKRLPSKYHTWASWDDIIPPLATSKPTSGPLTPTGSSLSQHPPEYWTEPTRVQPALGLAPGSASHTAPEARDTPSNEFLINSFVGNDTVSSFDDRNKGMFKSWPLLPTDEGRVHPLKEDRNNVMRLNDEGISSGMRLGEEMGGGLRLSPHDGRLALVSPSNRSSNGHMGHVSSGHGSGTIMGLAVTDNRIGMAPIDSRLGLPPPVHVDNRMSEGRMGLPSGHGADNRIGLPPSNHPSDARMVMSPSSAGGLGYAPPQYGGVPRYYGFNNSSSSSQGSVSGRSEKESESMTSSFSGFSISSHSNASVSAHAHPSALYNNGNSNSGSIKMGGGGSSDLKSGSMNSMYYSHPHNISHVNNYSSGSYNSGPYTSMSSSSSSHPHGVTSSGSKGDHHSSSNNQINIERILSLHDMRTSIMIKNIPNKYTQHMMLEYLSSFNGTFDFFYLPIDFSTRANKGYAFVNFIDPKTIVRFMQELDGKPWPIFKSEKICNTLYAHIQGKQVLINRYQKSNIMEEEEIFRPIIFFSDGPDKGRREPFPTPSPM